MYEALEHYKVYKQEKDLQTKIAKEFGLDKAIDELMTKDLSHKEFDKQLNKLNSDNSSKLVTDYNKESFDEWMKDLIARNGTTKY